MCSLFCEKMAIVEGVISVLFIFTSDSCDKGASATDDGILRHPHHWKEAEHPSKMVDIDALLMPSDSSVKGNISIHETGRKCYPTSGWDDVDDDDYEKHSCRQTEWALSDFETRAFDQGYREALRRDYPDEEERGRLKGFADAFRMVGSVQISGIAVAETVGSPARECSVKKAANNTCRKGDDVKSEMERREIADHVALSGDSVESCASALDAVNIVSTSRPEVCSTLKDNFTLVQHPTYVLSVLEGTLSLMLLRCQTIMSEEHLREVVSIRECIKEQLQKISSSFDLVGENSIEVTFGDELNCSTSAEGSEKTQRYDTNDDSCKSVGVETERKILPSAFCKPLTAVHEQVKSLLNRSKSVFSHYHWRMPLNIAT